MTSDRDLKEKINSDGSVIKDLPATLENPGFAEEEMIVCGKCGRTNPPNRLACFYCGRGLAIAPDKIDAVRLSARKLETWEKGFNVIIHRPNEISNESGLRNLASDLSLDRESLKKILDSAGPMPLARVENEKEAELIYSRLGKLDIDCSILTDENIGAEIPPRRIRGLEFLEDRAIAIDFNTRERVEIAPTELVLIVAGSLLEQKTASLEKKKKRETKIIEQTETATDESVIDLYSRDDHVGIRIHASGFDFSCLGSDKVLLAAQNMPKLLQKLCETFRDAKLIEEYRSVQNGLSAVWELETKKNSEGLRRSGFAKADFGSVVTVNNLSQFNRYSRMLRRLI